jgi:hypothetical protein
MHDVDGDDDGGSENFARKSISAATRETKNKFVSFELPPRNGSEKSIASDFTCETPAAACVDVVGGDSSSSGHMQQPLERNFSAMNLITT